MPASVEHALDGSRLNPRDGVTQALTPGPGETLDRLARDWWIFQLADGHRYSTDDLLTAWTAVMAAPRARRLLDLGCGVGSVGLIALGSLSPSARLVGVEVQPRSADLARRTVAFNRLEGRVEVRCADLRDASTLLPAERYDLILANPPYLPPTAACISPHPQRAGARIELHGDIFDYCRVAAAHLAGDGFFCFSHAASDVRPERALARAGLRMLSRREVIFREGRRPVIALYVAARTGEPSDTSPLLVRDRTGRRSARFVEIRRALGIDE